MLDAPESADADRPAWHAAAAGAWRDLLAALDRHWIGAVCGASVASRAVVRISLPRPCDAPAPRGPVRLGTMAHLGLHLGLGALDD